jgi:Tfp pilus assembly protein PilZ
MRTIELTLATVGAGILYSAYIYYLYEKGNDILPTNLWFTIGSMIDEFLFNSGSKPKKDIQGAPNRLITWIEGS